MTAHCESTTKASEEHSLPDCLTLWFCIGCGAMGNAEPCQGACNFRRLEIVSAAEFADGLEQLALVQSEVASWTGVVQLFAILPADGDDWESRYCALQDRANAALKSAKAAVELVPTPAELTDARAEVWRCTTCGQVEAPQECLGICIRRNGDFVRREDHQHVVDQCAAALHEVQHLRALVTQWATVKPRAGQWERSYRALQARATALLAKAAKRG